VSLSLVSTPKFVLEARHFARDLAARLTDLRAYFKRNEKSVYSVRLYGLRFALLEPGQNCA